MYNPNKIRRTRTYDNEWSNETIKQYRKEYYQANKDKLTYKVIKEKGYINSESTKKSNNIQKQKNLQRKMLQDDLKRTLRDRAKKFGVTGVEYMNTEELNFWGNPITCQDEDGNISKLNPAMFCYKLDSVVNTSLNMDDF